MIRSFKVIATMRLDNPELGLVRETPETPGARPTWHVSPGGGRVHGNTAAAARRRGVPVHQAELFPEVAS